MKANKEKEKKELIKEMETKMVKEEENMKKENEDLKISKLHSKWLLSKALLVCLLLNVKFCWDKNASKCHINLLFLTLKLI